MKTRPPLGLASACMLILFAMFSSGVARSAPPIEPDEASPSLPARRVSAFEMNSPEYGAQVFMWWRPETAERDLELARGAGLTFVKQTFAWRDIEGAAKGAFDWSRADAAVQLARAKGLKLVARLDNAPDWAAPGCYDAAQKTMGPARNLQDWVDFVGAFAARYRGQIHAYEIWNEPNLAREWCGRQPDPAAYAAMLRASYQTLKAVDPDALVISAGMSPTTQNNAGAMPDAQFIERLYDAMQSDELGPHNSDGYFDALGVHAPGFLAPPELGPDDAAENSEYNHGEGAAGRIYCFRHVEDLRRLMVARGDAAKQIAILEFGWTSNPVHPIHSWFRVDEQTKGQYIARAFEYAKQHWSPWVGWMSAIYLANPDWTPEDEEYWWALTDPDGTPRPGYVQIQQALMQSTVTAGTRNPNSDEPEPKTVIGTQTNAGERRFLFRANPRPSASEKSLLLAQRFPKRGAVLDSPTAAPDVAANRIAKWNGKQWAALGDGMGCGISYCTPWVTALDMGADELFAGGLFTTAGNISAANVSRWKASKWSALGSGVNGWVNAVAVNGRNVYIAGYFTNVGGVPAYSIARWNTRTRTWRALGEGIGGGPVYALAVDGDNVYAAGYFVNAGDASARNIAKWNGSRWSALDNGINGTVYALTVQDHIVYAGGAFFQAGGVNAKNIAKWNGKRWSALGSGVEGTVYALARKKGGVYVGGNFTAAGSLSARNVAVWNGKRWQALGKGVNGPVRALALQQGELFVGGDFTAAGNTAAQNIARWDGKRWRKLGSGVDGIVYALTVTDRAVYAGGYFSNAGNLAEGASEMDGE
ncbi:MAG: beta-galactosidase [Chloroflexi bacterium]|nr:beta-galactosidase [Chloroflexota bacterium]